MDQIISSLEQFWQFTGFANVAWQNLVMIAIGIGFITVAIIKEWEPLLLVPIGFGMIIGNIPMFPGLNIGIYENGSVLNTLYQGVKMGWYPPLIFLGIGAMTDFSALISQPRLILIGAAAQMGTFGAYLLAMHVGFLPNEDDKIDDEGREPDDPADAGDIAWRARTLEVEAKDSDRKRQENHDRQVSRENKRRNIPEWR